MLRSAQATSPIKHSVTTIQKLLILFLCQDPELHQNHWICESQDTSTPLRADPMLPPKLRPMNWIRKSDNCCHSGKDKWAVVETRHRPGNRSQGSVMLVVVYNLAPAPFSVSSLTPLNHVCNIQGQPLWRPMLTMAGDCDLPYLPTRRRSRFRFLYLMSVSKAERVS